MNKYSIKDLENITGIKAHTIRMWEKRYSVISPKRTASNIRFYSDKDLKKLMNISALNKSGIKISDIVEMSQSEICDKIIEINSAIGTVDAYLNDLILSAVELNEELFNKIIASCILKFGFERTYTNILHPLLEKIGIMWQAGSIDPAQEHFISNLIRQKIIVAIDNISGIFYEGVESIILFLPEKELHEIGLLFYYYLLKKSGYKVIYLGQSVPMSDLQKIIRINKTRFLLSTFSTGQTKKQLQSYLNLLSNSYPDNTFLVGGLQLKEQSFEFPPNIIMVQDFNDIMANLKIASI